MLSPLSQSPLAEFVLSRRNELGLSQTKLAELTGLSGGWFGRLESGSLVGKPKLETLEKLAPALRVTVAELMKIAGYRVTESSHEARLRQLHEIKTLNNSLGTMSDDGSVTPITSEQPRGNHGTDALRPAEFVLLPLYGPAACGSPLSWSYDDTQDRYPVPRIAIEHTQAAAVFKVSGDSMEAERIRDGDFVMVRPYNGDTPRHGDIVIVESEGGYVCKMYRKSLLGPYMESRYAEREPEIWKPAGEAMVVGLVVGIVNMNLYGGKR